jgi:hypothetical protein
LETLFPLDEEATEGVEEGVGAMGIEMFMLKKWDKWGKGKKGFSTWHLAAVASFRTMPRHVTGGVIIGL